MLELQLPRSMPHALPREPPFDFHFSSSTRPTSTRFDSSTVQMQLPVPRTSNGYELPTPRRPLTPPEVPGSAVKVVSLPPSQGAGQQFGYQLPAIGNSRSATAATSPVSQRQPQQQSQEVAQTPRKKWSISPNLRIPSTINTPQEGLPQLAAEVGAPIFPSYRATLTILDNMSFLVRELTGSEPSYGFVVLSSSRPAACPRCDTNHWIPKMGSDNLDDNAGRPECHSIGAPVCVEAEAN